MAKLTIEPHNKRIVAVMERAITRRLKSLERSVRKALVSGTKAWRQEVRALLSRPYSPKVRNTSMYPRKRSGALERSLHYRTRVTRGKHHVRATIYRNFEPFTNSDGFDYAEYLDESERSYGGYKERIYKMLEARIQKLIARKGF
jgi:hypothetical protein